MHPPSSPPTEEVGLNALDKPALRALRKSIDEKLSASLNHPRKKKQRTSYLLPEEIEAFFRQVIDGGSARDLALFEVAYHRGMRASEFALLKYEEMRVNAKRRWLYVWRLKRGNSHEHEITEREIESLKRYFRIRGYEKGPLFPSRSKKRRHIAANLAIAGALGRHELGLLHKRYAALANLPADKRHFHCWRHTCATQLMAMGIPVEDIQDHLGHADIRNTMIYAKLMSPRRQRTGEKLREAW